MISVITPYWNAERWLGRCCSSMHRQIGDFEFLLVNDHSTDQGEMIVRKYADIDGRFVVLDNERQKGVSGARNTGLVHARGEWITFLDADDELIGRAHKTFSKAIAGCKAANIIQLNHIRYYHKLSKGVVKYNNAPGIYHAPDLPEPWVGVWSKLFRAEFLKGIWFKEGMQYGEDGLFVLECLAKDERIFQAERDLHAVRHHFDNDQSLSHIKTAEDIIAQIGEYEAFLQKQDSRELKKLICLDLTKLWARAARRI